ncbi:leu operon leader peptide [Enterobacterales bacterium BIT-L3]|uniref:leu operon leader peptide n=2 Tax=Tenebrionibacter/Tenebrionicola group TaxID=2969848 RepID=A0A8K0V4D9_9ENTR|nr:leu operon leader peptide [Tenebrionibacter intestinalis]MBV5094348.1 leu operon leader peptide [Tenebrionicola larvae]
MIRGFLMFNIVRLAGLLLLNAFTVRGSLVGKAER